MKQMIARLLFVAATAAFMTACGSPQDDTAPIATPATLAPTPTPATLAPTPTPATLAPTPTPTTLAPTPSPTTLAPTPSLTTLAPTPSPTTLAPTPSPTTLAPTPSPTTLAPTPSLTNIGYYTYEHNRDRPAGGDCLSWPNFTVDLPPGWTSVGGDCVSALFISPDGLATFAAFVNDFTLYEGDRETVLSAMLLNVEDAYIQHDAAGTPYADVTITSSKRTEQHGLSVIYVTESRRGLQLNLCDAFGYSLNIPANSWSPGRERLISADAVRCEASLTDYAEFKGILDSFRLVEPY